MINVILYSVLHSMLIWPITGSLNADFENPLLRYTRGVAANVAASTPSKTRVSMPPLFLSGQRTSTGLNEEIPLLITDPRVVNPEAFTAEEKLVAQLLGRGSLTVRPNGHNNRSNHPVHVNITYNVVQILAFSQAEETMSISGWFTIKWHDPRLTWDPEEFGGITEVHLPSANLWIPDVGVMNGKSSSDFDFSAGVRGRLTVSSEGVTTWLHGAVLDTTCPLDVAFFPFDYQTCFLILTPWQSGVQQLLMEPFTHGSAVDNSYLPNSNVSEWEIQSVHFTSRKYRSDLNVTYQYVSIGIHLKRQPLYFVVLVLIPFSMLSALACLIFTLEDTGDRLSVALSLVLSMTMYVMIVSSNAPRSMRTLPVLGIFLLDQLGLLSIATVLAVINNKLRHATELLSWQDWIYTISGTNAHYDITFNSSIPNKRPTDKVHTKQHTFNNTCALIPKGPKKKAHRAKDRQRLNSGSRVFTNSIQGRQFAHPGHFAPSSNSDLDLSLSAEFQEQMQNHEIDQSRSYKPHNLTNGYVVHTNHSAAMFKQEGPDYDKNNHFTHHPMCNMNSKSEGMNRSPWLPPLRQTPLMIRQSDSSGDSTTTETPHSSPDRYTLVATVTAAAFAATSALLKSNMKNQEFENSRQSNIAISPSDEEHDQSFNSSETDSRIEAIKQARDTSRITIAAIHAALDAAHMARMERVKSFRLYKKQRKVSQTTFHSEQPEHPYRKLASKLDCIEMVVYLLLSTINAFVCLVIMPEFTQNTSPPRQWIS